MIETTVARLYDAATGQEDWEAALEAVRVEIGADMMFFGAGDPRAPETLERWSPGENPFWHRDAGYGDEDLWNPVVNPAIPAGMIMPTGRTFDHRVVVQEDVSRASEFVQDTVYKKGLAQHRLFVPMRSPSLLSGGMAGKTRDQAFEADEIERMDFLVQHLGRAMHLRQQVSRHREIEQGLSVFLDGMEMAVVLVDRDLNVLFSNRHAEMLVQAQSSVSLLRGQLSIGRREDLVLRRAILDVAEGRAVGQSPVVAIKDRFGETQVVARVHPGVGFSSVPGSSRVAAAILLEPVQAPTAAPDRDALMSAFGLTRAEATVARLVPKGVTRKAMGAELNLSENTIKTHLAAIRAKTGARNHVELAQMLQRLRV